MTTPWSWLQTPPAHHAVHAEKDWRDATLPDLARARAEAHPDAVAIIDEVRSLTWAQWLEEAERLAAGLQARGLAAGDVVAFQLPNWHEAAIVNLAAAMAGLVINPIVPIYRDAEVRQMLGDCGARAIFTCEEFRRFDFAEMADRIAGDLAELEHVFVVRGSRRDDYRTLLEEGATRTFDPPILDAQAVKLVLYTSGTTGRPKGVLHAQASLDFVLRRSAEHWGIEVGDAILMPSPVTHISGYCNGLEMPLVAGTTTILMESWNAEDALRLIEEHSVCGTVAATPFLVELAKAARAAGKRLPSLRFFACGGAAVPPDLIPAANDAFDNLQAFRVFGASEVPLVTYGWPDDETLAATTDGEVVDYEVRVVDDEDNEVPSGAEGELLARGPAMMLGYADAEQTAAALSADGFFRTGDLGTVDANGALTVTGRKKDLIIRGGENISAAEIEDVLRAHPAVDDAAVVAMPHERLGEGVCAYIVLSASDAPSPDDLNAHVQASGLAKQKTPERYEFVSEFPRTASGKVRKDQLRADVKEKIEAGG